MNPFTPDFGQQPPVLAGRDSEIAARLRALEAGPSDPAFTALALGPRGVGKTTMLAVVAAEAAAAGWRIIRVETPLSPQPGEGAVAAITEQAHDHLDDIDAPAKRKLTGLSAPLVGGGARWENVSNRQPTFHKLVGTLVDRAVAAGGAGVLLVMDEFHNLTPPEASTISGALQQITKLAHKNLAFVGVGLPHIESTLLADKGFTFFHRCARAPVENIDTADAMEAIGRPFADSGAPIGSPLLRRAADASRGMGYAMQSLGYHLWAAAPPPAEVTGVFVAQAVSRMEEDVGQRVTAPIWTRLSPTDVLFLTAMLDDNGVPTRLSDIAKRLGPAMPNASVYKKRLLREGAIVETGGGRVVFASGEIGHRAAEEKALAAQQALNAGVDPIPPTGPAPKCGRWMPRAKARCKLKAGHNGGCRC